MRFAIISDTHGNAANFKKAVKWLNKENIKLILHAGDIGNPESLQESLEDFNGEFLGVLGNMDRDFKIDIEKYQSKKAKVFEEILETEAGGKKIAVTHKPEPARELAETKEYDLVFYGHTHKPYLEKIKDCFLINPGELAGQMFKPCFAVYNTDTEKLELKILEKLD